MDIAYSIDGVPIRLTTERWFHIVENHDDLAVIYRQLSNTDGFIITAYFIGKVDRKKAVWKRD